MTGGIFGSLIGYKNELTGQILIPGSVCLSLMFFSFFQKFIICC